MKSNMKVLFMRKKKIVVLIFIFVCLLAFAFVFRSYIMFSRLAKQTAFHSCLASIHSALTEELNKNNATLEKFFSCADEQWKLLSHESCDKVVEELQKLYGLDAPVDWQSPFMDPWGSHIEIVCRKLPDMRYSTVVISNGPDGIYGTDDDLVRPYGFNEKIPELETSKSNKK